MLSKKITKKKKAQIVNIIRSCAGKITESATVVIFSFFLHKIYPKMNDLLR